MQYTTIRVKERTRDKVLNLRKIGESADDALDRLLPETDTLELLREKMRDSAEERMRGEYLAKIRALNEEKRGDAERAADALGHGVKVNTTTPALGFGKKKG